MLFLSESLFGSIKAKQPVEYTAAPRRQNMAELRRKRLTWIMEQCEKKFAGDISDSQLGSIQAICEEHKHKADILQKLNGFFAHNAEKGEQTSSKFAKMKQLVKHSAVSSVRTVDGKYGYNGTGTAALRPVRSQPKGGRRPWQRLIKQFVMR